MLEEPPHPRRVIPCAQIRQPTRIALLPRIPIRARTVAHTRQRPAKRLIALRECDTARDARQLPHAAERVGQEVIRIRSRELCNPPIAVEVGVRAIVQDLRQPCIQIQLIRRRDGVGDLAQVVAETVSL